MASTNEDVAISQLTQHIEDLSTNNDIILEICANCGKEGSNLIIFATNVRQRRIVMHPAKRNTDQSINRNAKNA